MEKYTKEGLNIYFKREERYKLTNTEKAAIKICISYKRERTYYSTGVRLTDEEWKSIDTSKNKKLIEHRNNLENTFSKIKHFARKLIEDGKFSFDNLKARMDGTTCISIKDTILNKVKKLKGIEAFGTADTYISTYLSLSCNGANFKDILQLKYGNIQNDEISFLREKTIRTSREKKEVIAFITPEMWDIIKRRGNTDTDKENYIFPYLNCINNPVKRRNIIKDVVKRTNKSMKLLGAALGVANLTTYVARHNNFPFHLKTSKLQD